MFVVSTRILLLHYPLPIYDDFGCQVFGALSQLDCGSEVWERVLLQSFELLTESNDEPLAATLDFIFKAASQCQHLPEAVCILLSSSYSVFLAWFPHKHM